MTPMEAFLAGVFLGGGAVFLVAAVVYEILAKQHAVEPLKVWEADGHTYGMFEIGEEEK